MFSCTKSFIGEIRSKCLMGTVDFLKIGASLEGDYGTIPTDGNKNLTHPLFWVRFCLSTLKKWVDQL